MERCTANDTTDSLGTLQQSDCKETAVYRFVWEWGSEGFCCEGHRMTLDVVAKQQLQRGIAFFPLSPPTDRPPAPPAESKEVVELRTRLAKLVDENTTLLARVRELENELDDPRFRLQPSEVERKASVGGGSHEQSLDADIPRHPREETEVLPEPALTPKHVVKKR